VSEPCFAKSGAFGTGCGDGHVTPKRVPHSNQGCCMGTCWKSSGLRRATLTRARRS